MKLSRFNKGPLTEKATRLLKRQKGKCGICKEYFFPIDVTEIDHIIPKHRGGQNWVRNLQLVHIYCHFKKTSEELKLKSKNKELYDGKLSRTVLK